MFCGGLFFYFKRKVLKVLKDILNINFAKNNENFKFLQENYL